MQNDARVDGLLGGLHFAHVDHFRLYAFFDAFQQQGVTAPLWASPNTIARLFDELLHYPWGFLAILSDPAPVPVLRLDPIRQWTFFSMFVGSVILQLILLFTRKPKWGILAYRNRFLIEVTLFSLNSNRVFLWKG